MAENDSNDLELIKSAVKRGGKIALKYFRKNPEVWTKNNKSPVSEADIAVDKFLFGTLKQSRPDYGWLSEETADNIERLKCDCTFIVDPIDGTREFLNDNDIWTVCIAIIRKGRPYAATIYNPVRDEMFTALSGTGAFLNSNPIEISKSTDLAGARLSAPRKIRKDKIWTEIGFDSKVFIGSLAYRLASIASSQLEAVVARATANDWDIAAADLIIHEAGGTLTDIEGNTLVYNRERTSHPALVAAPEAIHNQVLETAKNLI